MEKPDFAIFCNYPSLHEVIQFNILKKNVPTWEKVFSLKCAVYVVESRNISRLVLQNPRNQKKRSVVIPFAQNNQNTLHCSGLINTSAVVQCTLTLAVLVLVLAQPF